jgi:xanthine dehydrogenase molybdenum-binding subunit
MLKDKTEILGKAIPTFEVRDKVTGRSKFVDDMPAELFVKILGSPHPHAAIKRIDTSRAERLDGVNAILTHKEVPHKLIPSHRASYAMDEHLRYVGDYVVAVAASSEAIAEEALELIEVDYEVLPAVFDPEEAAQETAPKIYPEGNVYGTGKGDIVKGTHEPSMREWGDISRGFAEADGVVEDKFDIMPQIHSPMEPHVCIARWERGELIIYDSTQSPWELRKNASDFFEIPESKVVVLSPNIGGGFGAKYTGRYEMITCLLSKIADGKSTKLTFTREEENCYNRRPRGKVYAKVGAKKDGTITALQVRAYFDIGAYGNPGGGSEWCPVDHSQVSYKIKNARFEGWDVHTNHFRSGAMRSVDIPFVVFGVESVVDEVAEKLGLDPVTFRLKNMPETGDIVPPTTHIVNVQRGYPARLDLYPSKEMMVQVMEKIDWKGKWQGFGKPTLAEGAKRRGLGLAYSQGYCGFIGHDGRSAQVIINSDGSVIIHSGIQEIGQGINTTMCMLVAESLGISMDDIALITGDTRTGQQDMTNARASSELASSGHFHLMAIEDAKRKIAEMIAPVFNVKPEEIEIRSKKAYVKGKPEGAKSLRDLLSTSVTGSASGPPGSSYPDVKPGVKALQPMIYAVEVEVDIETGTVIPIKLVTGMFPGRMINPGIVRGQAIGGSVMSLGMALWEERKFDKETCSYHSKDFTDYKMPRALDVPELDTVMIEEVDETSPPHEGLPYGVRGIGEMTTWGAPAAVANAIHNAIGVRVKRSPMTAEVVLQALKKESEK